MVFFKNLFAQFMVILSQTCKLVTQITQVCKEIHDIKTSNQITSTLCQPRPPDNCKELPSDKCEKGGKDYTCSWDNRSCDHCVDPRNSPYNQICHASDSLSLPLPLPPEPPSLQSSHASEEASSSETSASFEQPASCHEDDTFALWLMSCSCCQRELQGEEGEIDSREGTEVKHSLDPISFIPFLFLPTTATPSTHSHPYSFCDPPRSPATLL